MIWHRTQRTRKGCDRQKTAPCVPSRRNDVISHIQSRPPLLLTYLTAGLLLIVLFVPTSARRPLHTTCATTATSSDTGSRHEQPKLKQATPAQAQQRSSSDDQYVYFMGESIFTDQFESYLQQVEFFENLPDIGKGVKGSLCRHYNFWETIGANQFILDTIKNGYIVPFNTVPPRMKMKNNKSAIKNEQFVDQSISDLLDSGCMQEVPFEPYVISPLSVAENKGSGKKRLILDLSQLNFFVEKRKDWNVAFNFFNKDCFLFKFDLKSGYHHIDICKKQISYFSFSWKNKFYCFNVLPFGLTSAPYIFTKCLRPIVKYWRNSGIDIVLYLDDGLGFGKDLQTCSNASIFIQNTLTQAGLLINKEKSIFQPVQCLEWLGLVWDSRLYSLSIPHRRIADTNDSIKFLVDRFPKFTARDLAKAVGKIISMSPVVGNVTSLMTRHIYLAIESRNHWDRFISFLFPDAVKSELQFWLQNLKKLNQKRLIQDSLPVTFVFSDASDIAAGAYTVEVNEKIFHCRSQ